MSSSSGRSGQNRAARETDGQDKSAGTKPTGTKPAGTAAAGQQPDPAQNAQPEAPRPARRRRRRRRRRRSAEQIDVTTVPLEPAPARHDGTRRRRPGRRMRTVDEISAGGLVVDSANSNAAVIGRIDRRGKLLWSLPKGHIEDGETAEQAAVREVAEETGIAATVTATLGSIEYWFVADGHRVHKTVHHFLLRAHGGELSDADTEVSEVAWVPLPELQQRLAYADERRLVRRAVELLTDPA